MRATQPHQLTPGACVWVGKINRIRVTVG